MALFTELKHQPQPRVAHWLGVALLASFGMGSPTSRAHQDTPLAIRPNGVLVGIPPQHGLFGLKITDLGSPTPGVAFRAGLRTNTLPPCLTHLVKSRHPEDIEAGASWYHERSWSLFGPSLPYYVHVTFFDPGRVRYRPDNSYTAITFSMENAKVLGFERVVVRPVAGGKDIRVERVGPAPGCDFQRDNSAEFLFR